MPDELRTALEHGEIRGPSGYDADRGLARLTAAIGAPAAAGTGAAKVISAGLAKKIGIIAVVVVGASGGTVALRHRWTHKAPPASPPSTQIEVPAVESPVVPPLSNDEAPRSSPSAAPDPQRAPTTSVRASSASDRHDRELRAEMDKLVEIRAAQASDPARALGLVRDADRQFPRGVFGEEREAIAIECLAHLGRTQEARARAQRFLTAHPRSPFAERVRRVSAP